jgi:Tol biopolymer transport system component
LGAILLVAALIGLVIGVYKFGARITNRQAQTVSENTVLRTVQVTTWTGLDFYPSFSPDGSSIAYSSERSGSFEIYETACARRARDSNHF